MAYVFEMLSKGFDEMTSDADTTAKKPSRKKKIILRIILVLIVLAALGGTGFTLMMKIKFADFQLPKSDANVIVTKVSPLSFDDKIEAIGTAQSNESANLTSTVTERVKTINFSEGDFVTAGTVLAELDNDEELATLNEATRSYMRYNSLARNNLSSVAERDTAKAKMEIAQSQLNDRRIVAPFDGLVGIREVSIGDLVSPGTLLTTIDDIDTIKVDFNVPEIYLADLKTGLELKARSEAYPHQEFTGKIYTVDSRVDPDTRSIRARALVENTDHRLRPGLLMKVEIVRSSETSPAVPEEALMSAGDQKFVYVVTPDSKIEKHEVKTGVREPGYVQILSGLENGDQVVVEGQMKTGPGASVKIAEERSLADTQEKAIDFAVPRKKEVIEPLEHPVPEESKPEEKKAE